MNKIKPLYRLHFVVLLWGATGVIGKLISIDALPLVAIRCLIGFLSIGLFIRIKSIKWKLGKREILKYIGTGLLVGLHWVFFFKAIKVSNVAIGLSTMSTAALFAAFLEPLFFKRKIKWNEVLFALLVSLCMLVIFNVESQYFLGIVLGLFASFIGVIFSLLNAKFSEENRGDVIMFYELFGAMFFVGILSLSAGEIEVYSNLQMMDFIYLCILGGVLTAFPMVESVSLMKHISAFTLLLAVNLEPIYGIIMAYFIFGEEEKMSLSFYLASAMILVLVILNNRLFRKK